MRHALAVLAVLALPGCNNDKATEPPRPFAITADAIGHYCGMNVLEHTGPKGQILLKSRRDPVWFSSARDTLAFTMLPDEPKDIAAVFVSDMAKAPSWEEPGPENWVEARKAWFVVGGTARGGMGAEETVPFSDRDAAERFATEKGGHVYAFADVPREAVLTEGGEAPGQSAHSEDGDGGSGHPVAAPNLLGTQP
ncbi:nitrous oxide reductase accessory protein NosL [Alsobacter sp. SYSU M60028]|uniref:Nitrous oxide reductase accessory protein NosL n=1 Tax=Alsobacter ponti TaxID=2962936 RepID=A0ABT1L7D3_9HYPH|nr:nitrous oxide reductase accessory protein NosL [Alsobacter ponti]